VYTSQVHHIEKFIRKLDPKRRAHVQNAVSAILRGCMKGLDIEPIRGYKGYFRCRVGDVRIIFIRTHTGNVIDDIDWRGRAYRRFK